MSNLKKAENFVYFNPNTCNFLEHQHYDIGIELQATCSVPPVETMGIMLPNEEYYSNCTQNGQNLLYILSAVRLIKIYLYVSSQRRHFKIQNYKYIIIPNCTQRVNGFCISEFNKVNECIMSEL